MDSEATDSEPAGSQPVDEDLLRRLSSDPAAFEIFYRRHVDRVIGFATRRVRDPADAADLVAATFVTVLTAAPSYDADRGQPGAWLLGITARLIANARRRKVRESAALARIVGRRLVDQSDIERLEERIDAARSSQAVLAALDRLRPRAREALLLVSEAGLQPTEAARVLGISPAAFRMRLSSARRPAAQLRAQVRAGKVTLIGPATVDGQRAIHLVERTGHGAIRLWVSPSTYLPIREIDTAPGVSPASPRAIRDDYRWLPATPASLRLLTPAAAIPSGFTRTTMNNGR